MNFLHVFTLFVIDIHKIMLISLFPTPFGHFQFLGSAGQNPKLIGKGFDKLDLAGGEHLMEPFEIQGKLEVELTAARDEIAQMRQVCRS